MSEIEDLEIQLLLEALFQRYHYDFRHYARASIKRRLQQARLQLGYPTISAMQERVLHDAAALPRCTDPDDQKFLALAQDAAVDWLLTRDKALLRLNRRAKLAGFRVGSPADWSAACTHPA